MFEVDAHDAPSGSEPPRIILRSEIRELIRRARRAKKLTQAQLGEALGVNRTQMNRIEMGTAEISRHLGELLGEVLDLPDLVATFSERVRPDPSERMSRDKAMERLFALPGLETVTIVVADDLDVHRAVYDSRRDTPLLDARSIEVVFPTVERERELFHGQPIYGFVEYQIKHLADLQGAEDLGLNNLRMYESDSVLASAVIARTRTGTECAYWAPLPTAGGSTGSALPVASGNDPATTGRLESYAAGLLADTPEITTNEALRMVQPAGDRSPGNTARFTRYFEVGTDQEEDVDDHEGFAVALVLTVARCPRRQFGVARRVVTHGRPRARHDHRLSLFGNQVDAADLREARTTERGYASDTTRSRGGPLRAALDIDEYVRSHGGDVPDLAFQIAAAREFRMFGLDIATDRLHREDLPAELQLISRPAADGPGRAAIAPRLFVLELDDHGGRPELDTLAAIADIEEIGISDLEIQDDRLDDFLRRATTCGFLGPLLRGLDIADR